MDSGELNIPSTVQDPHYRYRMPRIQIVSQGSGNGIKTKWINLTEVSSALKVPVEYPLKFIGKELGSNTEIKSNTFLINGNHKVEKMQELLDKFIKKYVLCPKCKLPEIHGKISINKKKEIQCVCRSCGAVSKLDSTHDFASYIKRNPPQYEGDDNTGEGNSKQKGKKTSSLDSKTKSKIKNFSINLPKNLIKYSGDENEENDKKYIQENIEIIQKLFDENEFTFDIKFYALANGIFDDKIYTKLLIKKLEIIKHFINQEPNKNEEALFFFLVGFWDLMFARQKGEHSDYLSSILYYFYDKDIIREEFWKNFTKKNIKFNSVLITPDTYDKFINSSKDFTNWIENGPYEGDEEVKKEEENKESEKKEDEAKEEEIDIDNI